MNYFLTDDQLEMQELARRIAVEKMKPLSEKYDEEGIFPWDIVDVGVSREFLWREWERYREGVATAKCPPAGCAACKRCGIYDAETMA